ncbi:MAG: hypothetical protein IPL61_25745 [Myxococcales bacterium]|nr:hypothetical protein [Myxococcales bacterium]
MVFSIDDARPWVLIGFGESGSSATAITRSSQQFVVRHDPSIHGAVPRAGFAWWACCPLAPSRESIGDGRRFGRFDIEIVEPREVVVTCIVWPGKYFGPNEYRRVLDEIYTEYGRTVEWLPGADAVRSYTRRRSGVRRNADVAAATVRELRACQQWLAVNRSKSEEALPEQGLVAAWAMRRALMLAAIRDQLEAHRRAERDLASAGGEIPSPAQRKRVEEAADAITQLFYQVSQVARRLHGKLGPFRLSPAMQRDHRLRRLMDAFVATERERWADAQTDAFSESPPLRATRVFELWCTARIVASLELLGWEVSGRRTFFSEPDGGMPIHHEVVLRRTGDVAQLEYQPAIKDLGVSGLLDMHRRGRQGIDILGARPTAPVGLVSYGRETPDFAIRYTSADGRRAFAIGDATLTDPERGGVSLKIDKMITYRDRVAWRIDGRLIRCEGAGTFIVLPGPAAQWSKALSTRPCDSVICLPTPALVHDSEMTTRLGALMGFLDRQRHEADYQTLCPCRGRNSTSRIAGQRLPQIETAGSPRVTASMADLSFSPVRT